MGPRAGGQVFRYGRSKSTNEIKNRIRIRIRLGLGFKIKIRRKTPGGTGGPF